MSLNKPSPKVFLKKFTVLLYSRSFWNRVKFPLDQRFSETYVVSGIDRSGEKSQSHDGDGDTMNIASFVRKTKELLLNEEVLKEVEEAAPGDQVEFLLPCGCDTKNSSD